MKNFIAVVILALLPAIAMAGGGTKATSNIKVTNASAGTVAVIVDTTLTAAQAANLTQAQFHAQGGVLLNGGESHTFAVKAGAHVVTAAYINTTTGKFVAANVGSVNVNVANNQTRNVVVTGSATTKAVIN